MFFIVMPASSIFKIARSWDKKNPTINDLNTQNTILFLRSFERDHYEEEWEDLFLGFFDAKPIALGNPSEYLEPLGKAERIYLKETENWKEKIKDLAKNAEGIILRIGNKRNLVWEIENLLKYCKPSHVILYSPPLNDKDYLKIEYEKFYTTVNHLFNNGLPKYTEPYRGLVISFDDEWNSKFLKVPLIIKIADKLEKLALSELDDELVLNSQIRRILQNDGNANISFYMKIFSSFCSSLFTIFIFIFFIVAMIIHFCK